MMFVGDGMGESGMKGRTPDVGPFLFGLKTLTRLETR